MTEMSRRRLMGQAAAAVAAVGGTTVTKAAPGVNPTRRTPRAQDGKTEITIYHIWGTPPGGTPAATPHPMTQVIDAFNAQSQTVTLNTSTPGNYYETLQKTQADLAAGNPPDLVSVPWAFLNYAVDGLGVKDLATVAGDGYDALRASMSETAWELVTKDDTAYGFPWGLSTPIFYYNADVFEAAGVDPAVAFDTWANFAAEAPKLQAKLGGNPVLALSYNKDCTGGTGWHYDNLAAPANIELCKATCDAVKATAGGKVSIAFGCATKGGVK